ncbi:ubiquinone biosynthesis protein COQ9, mitochondrial [Coccinella septempunctata]|uniref:ubiquinone biosynthesis protein COQ9, mitochondrial n=1 Tax=Coccinella septempunctata TaxID=41139 RepID=UPI001D05DF14|nr:ubiquinone biosynthesis protein COQ9, mitochondrial [Coccinella septempunctata]
MSCVIRFRPLIAARFAIGQKNYCNTIRHFSKRDGEDNFINSEDYESDIKSKILREALKFVPEKGWTKDAVTAGAHVAGYPGVVHGLFPGAGADLVNFFLSDSNKQLVEILKNYQKEPELQSITPVQFVEKAIQQKLLMLVPYKSKWPQAIAIMSLPPNVPTALASLLTLVDDICYYAGDRSVDFNWYARRIGVAGIYKTTELYLIQDNSPDHIKTFEFLNKRLSEAVVIHDLICKNDTANPGTKDSIVSAFVTARNILGLNWNR